MPEEKTVDIDTTGPGAEVNIEEEKKTFLLKTLIYIAPETWYKLPETIRQLRLKISFNRSQIGFLIHA